MESNIKNILVVGKNSFVGNSFDSYIDKYGSYLCEKISVRNDAWKLNDFSKYDSIFYVAGIAHSDNGKIGKEKSKWYYKVNTDLTVNVAKKAKKGGIKQFIFMSSSIVYGASAPIGEKKIITKDTIPSPANAYGDSKLKAEDGLRELEDDNFKVAIIRSPMVYGDGCKGNYRMLEKFAKITPVFPYIENERSVINIDKLCEVVKDIIDNNKSGIFLPQDEKYMCTSLKVREIGKKYGKKIVLIKGLDEMFKIMGRFIPKINKIFGNFVYMRAS